MSITEKRHTDPERAQSRRRQVLDAAATCFSRSGFHGASMAEISKAAGMSAGHIYNYFDGKDAIIAAFVEEEVERVALLLRDLEQKDDPLQAIVDESDNSVDEHMAPEFWKLKLEIFAEASRNPKVAAVLVDADRRMRTQFRAIVKAGRERHGLDADDVTIDGRLEATVALFQGLALRALHYPELDKAALKRAYRVGLSALLLS
ncbi:TetR/AcrR family transcriptional regulator [Duganella sp. LX20W]|uniref:TetR/AcrR family transcriptional regulator n=1 Tax=Rugamonas brunnea TaxID=2758569 RepID=A0A7W2IDV6_9BURK|nr:TetR/AcrR family transcriptional regulator [Rugamonas brunnea]MBA5639402.1 TetR/AcrR family transcriptional regulator [Rugamonas brunnea]